MADEVAGESPAGWVGPRVVVPAHGRRTVAWRQTHRGGTVDDRTLGEVTVSIPPQVAGLDPRVPNDLLAECDLAVRAIARLDETGGEHLRPLATLLLRAESVASSKIEHEDASIEDFARALHGVKANSSAGSSSTLPKASPVVHEATPQPSPKLHSGAKPAAASS